MPRVRLHPARACRKDGGVPGYVVRSIRSTCCWAVGLDQLSRGGVEDSSTQPGLGLLVWPGIPSGQVARALETGLLPKEAKCYSRLSERVRR
jgi:hypothetical protein